MKARAAVEQLPIQREATLGFRLVRWVGTPILHLLFRIDMTGRENIPTQGAFVIIANHLNWLDSFLILLAFPAEPRVHFLADPELLTKRRLQWWVVRKTAGYIVVERTHHGDLGLFRRVARCLEVGGVVGVYPEGAYGREEGKLLPLKRGFAHFALQSGVPVIPVALSGTKALWLRKRVKVIVGPRIAPDGHSVESLSGIAAAQLAELLPPYRDTTQVKLFEKRLTSLF